MSDLFAMGTGEGTLGITEFLAQILEGADLYFSKLLSRNDCSWADTPEKNHQAGFYVPETIRNGGFFPELTKRTDKPHIYEVLLNTVWPNIKEKRESRFTHYSNKGPEAHITRVPKEEFMALGPASLLVIARKKDSTTGAFEYHCIVIDSKSPDYDLAVDYLELGPEFLFGIFEVKKPLDELEQLIEELLEAIEKDRLGKFIRSSLLPTTQKMSELARDKYASIHGIRDFDPFTLKAPGDLISGIIELEYDDFRKREIRLRVAEIAQALVNRGIHKGGIRSIVAAIVIGFDDVSSIFKSMRGSRATRAGTSFELHIKTLLDGGKIPYQYQAMIGRRTPDFMLPSMAFYDRKDRKPQDAIILTAKTTLRERWQQILNEGKNVEFWHLATLDKTVTAESLDEMEELGVVLVVPESIKDDSYTLYEKRPMVITFADFFRDEVKPKLGLWV